MNGRLQSLVDRGYSIEEVLELSSFTEEQLNICSNLALEQVSLGCEGNLSHPFAYYIGGQPGCGKTTMALKEKSKRKNSIIIGIDNYRTYHPNYLKMEEAIKKHWEDREISENDTPGNDMADFTHLFSGAMTDEIIKKATDRHYNVIIEWGMREPTAPLENMIQLRAKGYKINVSFVLVDKYTSMDACNLRSDVMNSHDRIVRRVPPSFHKLCVDTLPASLSYLYECGYKNYIIDDIDLINRKNEKIWDVDSLLNPQEVYSGYLDSKLFEEYNSPDYAELAFDLESEGINIINDFYKDEKKDIKM